MSGWGARRHVLILWLYVHLVFQSLDDTVLFHLVIYNTENCSSDRLIAIGQIYTRSSVHICGGESPNIFFFAFYWKIRTRDVLLVSDWLFSIILVSDWLMSNACESESDLAVSSF